MILHHYIWGTDDVQIVEELPPHFLIVKSTIGNGNLALFSKLSEQQGRYFRNANKRFYDAGFNENGESMDPSDEYIPFVPDIMFDDNCKGYLLLIQPSALNTLEGVMYTIGLDTDQGTLRELAVNELPDADRLPEGAYL